MSSEEEVPESVKTTLDAMRGKENAYGLQNKLVLFFIITLVSGLLFVKFFARYAEHDSMAATNNVVGLLFAWGLCMCAAGIIIFRKKEKGPSSLN